MKFLLVLATVIAITHAHSPVLLWPADEFSVPEGQSALDSMNLEDFRKLFAGKKIVVFSKKQFSLEEVSYPKKELSYLQSTDAIALQGVKSIHHFIGALTSSEDLKVVKLSDASLDEQQEEIKNTMTSNPGFAAILVGSGPHRSRRAADTTDPKPACTSETDTACLAYVGDVKLYKKAGETAGTCKVTCQNGTGLTIKIGDDVDLTVLKDAKSGGYDLRVSETYEIDSETTWAPDGFSYSCMALRLVPKTKDKGLPIITLKSLQLYPDKRGEGTYVFPESYDCSTWFTPAIWMGVVMATFYIFLLFGAVVFLLDVKTNDRFDDPKGKTITVNVAE